MSYKLSHRSGDINTVNKRQTQFYEYEFDYVFRSVKDEVYCALSPAYDYTKLRSHIYQLQLLA